VGAGGSALKQEWGRNQGGVRWGRRDNAARCARVGGAGWRDALGEEGTGKGRRGRSGAARWGRKGAARRAGEEGAGRRAGRRRGRADAGC
jgi:hypothetical protein